MRHKVIKQKHSLYDLGGVPGNPFSALTPGKHRRPNKDSENIKGCKSFYVMRNLDWFQFSTLVQINQYDSCCSLENVKLFNSH